MVCGVCGVWWRVFKKKTTHAFGGWGFCWLCVCVVPYVCMCACARGGAVVGVLCVVRVGQCCLFIVATGAAFYSYFFY